MSTYPWNISTSCVSFFHVLYDNAMNLILISNLSGLLPLNIWMLRLIGRLGWKVSVNKLVGRSGPTQRKCEYYDAISTRGLMYCTTKHGPYNPSYQCFLYNSRYFHFSSAPAKPAAQQSSPPHSVPQQVPQIHPHPALRFHE